MDSPLVALDEILGRERPLRLDHARLVESLSFSELIEVAKSQLASVDLVELLGILLLIVAVELICDVDIYDLLTLDSHGRPLLLLIPVIAAHYSCHGPWTVLDTVIPVATVVIFNNILCQWRAQIFANRPVLGNNLTLQVAVFVEDFETFELA